MIGRDRSDISYIFFGCDFSVCVSSEEEEAQHAEAILFCVECGWAVCWLSATQTCHWRVCALPHVSCGPKYRGSWPSESVGALEGCGTYPTRAKVPHHDAASVVGQIVSARFCRGGHADTNWSDGRASSLFRVANQFVSRGARGSWTWSGRGGFSSGFARWKCCLSVVVLLFELFWGSHWISVTDATHGWVDWQFARRDGLCSPKSYRSEMSGTIAFCACITYADVFWGEVFL